MATPALRTAEELGLPRRATLTEYFAIDDAAAGKCEYHGGTVVCMPGGTEFHALITMNVGRALGNRLEDGPCRVYSPDLRIAVPRKTYFMYPDVPVICGPSEYDPRDPAGRTIVNPKVVVEVLSPSTERFDRGVKFERYLELPSLEEYVLVLQERPRVEAFRRHPSGGWLFTYAAGLDASLHLGSLGIDLPLKTVYAGVTFPPPPADEADAPDAPLP